MTLKCMGICSNDIEVILQVIHSLIEIVAKGEVFY